MDLIQTVTVGAGGAASITFTSIPQTFTDLYLVFSVRPDSATTDTQISFNGNTANFSRRHVFGNGSSAGSSNASDRYIGSNPNSSYTANTFGNHLMYIPNYTASLAKSYFADSVAENNATTSVQVILAGLWNDTSAITSLSLSVFGSGNFVQYSSASLYGILKGSDGTTTVS
jgi:hypothetical protein